MMVRPPELGAHPNLEMVSGFHNDHRFEGVPHRAPEKSLHHTVFDWIPLG